MQERKKKKIVIASVLKPVDETRMYGKIAISLASQGHEVHVYGSTNTQLSQNKTVYLHGHILLKRLNLHRLIIPWHLFRKWLAVKPAILIICTHELLMVALIYKLLKPVKLIYDVQENYYLNILHTSAFPAIVRFPIAFYTRLKENLSAILIDHFFLAESVYAEQLGFTKSTYSIIGNMVSKPEATLPKHKGHTNWLFSGTLAESTGVYKVIELVKALHSIDSTVNLTICGFAPSVKEQLRIQAACTGLDYISLKGIETLLSHSAIVEAIKQADIGFIYYPPAKHTAGRIPTKFYEYSSLNLPILTWKNQAIASKVIEFGLGWVLDGNESITEVLIKINSLPITKPLPAAHFWEHTEKQLFKVIDSL